MGLAPGPAPPSFEDVMASLENSPLFMKNLPEDISDDPTLSALQALVHEGTPDERSRTFKDNGNDYFKGKRYREALGFYTQGLEAEPTDSTLKESLLLNRAACLEFDPSNAAVAQLREKSIKAEADRVEKIRIREEREKHEQAQERQLQLAFKERSLTQTSSPNSPDSPYRPHIDDGTGSLVVPVFFLYPQYGQSDTIGGFHEQDPFSAHLEAMFPPAAPYPDWDTKHEYGASNLQVGKNMTLADVFHASRGKPGEAPDGLELIDGFLTFTVVPKGEEERWWVAEFKKSRDSR
ncbi:hypothetical protein PUNSTDRAFT_43375 [Punctularia strigosozonata HHB-11173 SS5]|uniref:uncharacterized protein n=1 Tax=Punctularia strigosozonata (strain HHB-11173) TaxID=741275 RepID=UPI00044173FF|nr:uncharacterized protein PUNSTDRAFT_43375 [Punctularia strigosozonata HHB-11173 SS5]EIN10474.1 hypothetical protein PUNSTDRAFT_43375 [Punctularia strigosozonata HHB-11173 SS5]